MPQLIAAQRIRRAGHPLTPWGARRTTGEMTDSHQRFFDQLEELHSELDQVA
ncbi:hypothetical protein ACQPZ2_27895 [Nocardia pseudovaccinii]|uniref:hypothetical protein n=1 Tax=Nocardia pseudovaccinii TaxID=189540 RepID=UPI003D8B6849